MHVIRIVFFAFFLASLSSPAHGQTIKNIYEDAGAQIGLEYAKPIFEGSSRYTIATAAWYLSGQIPILESATILVDFPMAYADISSGGSIFGQSTGLRVGNPFIGIKFRSRFSNVYGIFGSRIPLAHSRGALARSIGRAGGGVMRLGSFLADIFQLNAKIGVRHHASSGLFVNVLLGPSAFFFIDSDIDPEIFLDAEAVIGYKIEDFRGIFGLDGRLRTTGFDGSFADKSVADLFLQGTIRFNQVRPVVAVFLPVDENSLADLIVSLTLVVHLN